MVGGGGGGGGRRNFFRKWLVAALVVGSNTLMVGSNGEKKMYSILGMTKKIHSLFMEIIVF